MFGLNLKKLRLTNGITQTQLARDLDVSNGTVGNWESGARRHILRRIFPMISHGFSHGIPQSPLNKGSLRIRNGFKSRFSQK